MYRLWRYAPELLTALTKMDELCKRMDSEPLNRPEGEMDENVALLRRVNRMTFGLREHPTWPAWTETTDDAAVDLLRTIFRYEYDAGRYTAAMIVAQAHRDFVLRYRPGFPPDFDDSAYEEAMLEVGMVYYAMGEYARALECVGPTGCSIRDNHPHDSPLVRTADMLCLRCCEKLGDESGTLVRLRSMSAGAREEFGPDSEACAGLIVQQLDVYLRMERLDDAMALAWQIDRIRRALGQDEEAAAAEVRRVQAAMDAQAGNDTQG